MIINEFSEEHRHAHTHTHVDVYTTLRLDSHNGLGCMKLAHGFLDSLDHGSYIEFLSALM
jgi:hypothetical protein